MSTFWIEFTGITLIFLVIWLGYKSVSYGEIAMLIVYLEVFMLAFVLALYFFLSDRITVLTGFPSI